ncbi:hypothetical protein QTI17_28740 [Variovorax sp. J31P179]|nr:hypothetical protein [Variovorax sp. J31P179]
MGMIRDVEVASELLADAGVDVVVFHCTAASTYSTELEASILERIEGATRLPAVATSQALVAALEDLKARRVVLLSPYLAAVNEREAAYFVHRGFDVLGNAGLGCSTGREMMAVTPEAWQAFALSHAHAQSDAYVLSCTTVRTAEAVESLEQSLGRPVITSNSAVAWYCMRKLGVTTEVPGYVDCSPVPIPSESGMQTSGICVEACLTQPRRVYMTPLGWKAGSPLQSLHHRAGWGGLRSSSGASCGRAAASRAMVR